MNGILPGVKQLTHLRHLDERGYFTTLTNTDIDGMRGSFRQINIAKSKYNVLRGMHRQNQTKLIMPIVGQIFDVVLNPETGDWCGFKLDSETALMIPPQYAHGYLVLSEYAVVQYVVDSRYNQLEEENFKWNGYGITWPISSNPILSEKDQ